MSIFSINSGKLDLISESSFKHEKDLQKITEDNLKIIFDLDFIISEFSLGDLRIDTLGFDKKSKSFVIIEYKRDKSSSITDQGFAYLALLEKNHAEFILAYNEKNFKALRKKDVNWKESKIIFIANSFTIHQKKAIELENLPMELYEVKEYANQTISFNSIQSPKKRKTSFSSSYYNTKNSDQSQYSEKYYFKKVGNADRISLYKELKQQIQNLGDVVPVFRRHTVNFKSKKLFVSIAICQKFLHVGISLKPSEIDDPKNIVRDMTSIGHWGVGNSRVTITEKSEIPYLMSIIEQSYSKVS